MRLLTPLGGGERAAALSLPGIRPGDLTFASNQVRIRLPRDPAKAWQLTRAVVDRLTAGRRLMRPFRFLTDAADPVPGRTLAETARRAEAIGFSVLVIPDHLVGQLAPIPAMATVAAATERLRIGTFVLNNDLRHPAVLAQDLATLDVLSGGRLDIGIGAGWNRPEYDAIGLPFDPVGTRVGPAGGGDRGPQGLLRRRPVQLRRRHYTITDYDGRRSRSSGRTRRSSSAAAAAACSSLAAREADIVGLAPRLMPGDQARPADPRSITSGGDRGEDRLGPRGGRRAVRRASSSTSTRPWPSPITDRPARPRPGRPSTGSGRGPASRSARTTCSRRRTYHRLGRRARREVRRCSASGSGSARS